MIQYLEDTQYLAIAAEGLCKKLYELVEFNHHANAIEFKINGGDMAIRDYFADVTEKAKLILSREIQETQELMEGANVEIKN